MNCARIKLPTFFLSLTFVGLLFAISPAIAGDGGGAVGPGGGHMVRMPDGSMVPADRFVQSLDDQPLADFEGKVYQPTGDVLSALNHMADLLTLFNADRTAGFYQSQILSKDIKFVIVNRLPADPVCHENPTLKNLPEGGQVVQVACTAGNETALLADYFSSPKVSDWDRARLLIHERLRSWHYPNPLIYISAITNGLQAVEDLYETQKAGKMPLLTNEQKKPIYNFVHAIALEGLTRFDRAYLDWDVTSGGALVEKTCSQNPNCLNRNAYIGVGAGMVRNDSKIASGAIIVGSLVYSNHYEMGANSHIQNSKLNSSIVLEDSVSIVGSDLTDANYFGAPPQGKFDSIGAGLRLGDSCIIKAARGSQILNSHMMCEVTIAKNSKIENVTLIEAGSFGLNVGPNSVLENVAPSRIADVWDGLLIGANAKLDFQGQPLNFGCGGTVGKGAIYWFRTLDGLFPFRAQTLNDFKGRVVCHAQDSKADGLNDLEWRKMNSVSK